MENKKCKTISKMWRESGKQMPFKEFATLYNSGGLDAYLSQQQTKGRPIDEFYPDKPTTKQPPIKTEIACPAKKEKSNTETFLQVAALVLIIAGTVYLITKKSE